MATKKAKQVNDAIDPVVIVGSHSIRREYADGRVEFESDWDKLKADVEAALADYAKTKPVVESKVAKKKAAPKSKIIKAVETTKKDLEKSLKKAPAKKTAEKKAVAKKASAKKTATKKKTK